MVVKSLKKESSNECTKVYWDPLNFMFDWLRSSFPGVMRPGRGGGNSLPSSVARKNEWSYAFPPPICLHGLDMASFAFYHIIRNIIGNEYSNHLQKQ